VPRKGQRLAGHAASLPFAPQRAKFSPEVKRQLEALGYLGQ
jgi:hypothetical protein